MVECTRAFDVPPMTVARSCVAWEIEPPRLLPLDCECILGFAPVLNVDRRLLRLLLRATYLSQGRGGKCASSPLLPCLPSFPRHLIRVRERLSPSGIMVHGLFRRLHRRREGPSEIGLHRTLSAFVLHGC